MIHQLTQTDLQRFTDMGILLEQIGYYMTLVPFDQKQVEVNVFNYQEKYVTDIILHKKSEITPEKEQSNKHKFAKIMKIYEEEKERASGIEADYIDAIEEQEREKEEVINYELEQLEKMRTGATAA